MVCAPVISSSPNLIPVDSPFIHYTALSTNTLSIHPIPKCLLPVSLALYTLSSCNHSIIPPPIVVAVIDKMARSNKSPIFKLTRHHFIKGQEQLSKEDLQVNTIPIRALVRTHTDFQLSAVRPRLARPSRWPLLAVSFSTCVCQTPSGALEEHWSQSAPFLHISLPFRSNVLSSTQLPSPSTSPRSSSRGLPSALPPSPTS